MRAIGLLCLLHVAFATAMYQWHPPGDQNPYPTPENACDIDQDSCGCCLMVQKVDRLKTDFNAALDRLWQEYLQTQEYFLSITNSRTAVSAALFTNGDLKCYGPFTEVKTIMYRHIFINLGNSYSVETGILTVRHSGVYSLTLTIYSDAGSPRNTLATCVGLRVNKEVLVGSRDRDNKDQEDSSTITVILLLEAGDTVDVILPIGCDLCDGRNHYNTFNVFLLYPTEYVREA